MNKQELVSEIAVIADLNKTDSEKALNAIVASITDTLKSGDEVALMGFGTFKVTDRAARDGRNPRTGESIKIAAAKVPKFTPGKGLKDAVN